ncbi:MAG: O-antigen ligase family protein [Patescibacteria group bacterium]|nr:O-antigen ligase family protein [Patescibacteria group bacterium]
MYSWFLLLIFYIPFQIALNPAPNFDVASLRVFIVLFFLIWLVKRIWTSDIRWALDVRNLQSVGLFLFFISILFSLIGSENAFWGARKVIFFASIFPLYFLTAALADSWVKIKKLFNVLIIGGVFFAFIGLLQFLFAFIFGLEEVCGFWTRNIVPVFSGFNFGALILAYPSWLVNVGGKTIVRAFSLFSDPHMFSFYLGMILPLIILSLSIIPALSFVIPARFAKASARRARFAKASARRAKAGIQYLPRKIQASSFTRTTIMYTSFIAVFAALLLSFARGAYAAAIVSFLLVSALVWIFLKKKKIPILLCSLLLIFIIPGTPISDRFYSSFDLSEGSNAGRLEMWRQSGQTGLNSFWNGVGLGNYSLVVNSDFGYRNPATAHNLYLDIFSEIGFIGLFFWLFLFFGTIWQLFQKLKETKVKEQKYVIIGLLGSFAYFLVHSFFETPIYNPSVLALLMVILGLSSVVVKTIEKFKDTPCQRKCN